MLPALDAKLDLKLHPMDVVADFLNSEIYKEQPDGCIDSSKRDWVCKM